MKTLKAFSRIATLTTLLIFLAAAALAQDPSPAPIVFGPVSSVTAQESPKDAVKIGVSFVNSEYALNPVAAVEYLQGISASLDAKIAAQKEGKGVRLGGVFYWKRDSFDAPTDTYAFGPRLSYRFSAFEPFGHALFGFNTTYNSDRAFTRVYGAGLDVNLGHIYFRPVEVNWQRTEGFLSPATQTYSAGAGVRF